MTIPETIILPRVSEQLLAGGGGALVAYLRELTFSLQSMYEQVAWGVNGDIFTDASEPSTAWSPIVKDTVNPATTFTYAHQTGWVYRNGIFVDVWFDVAWTANTGAITGNMYVELPYQVALTNDAPFVGVLQPSTFAFTGGTECVLNAVSDTYRAEVWNTGTGFATANQGSVAAGGLIGFVRYPGQEDE